jgi:hypothetical protein
MTLDEKNKIAALTNGGDLLDAIDTAMVAVPDLERRSHDADDLATNTKAGRAGLANAALVGLTVKAADIAKADRAVADAEAAATAARAGLEAARAAVADAEAAAVRTIYAERDAAFKAACVRRIAAAEELDRLGSAFGRAVAEFTDAGAALNPLLFSTEKLEQRLASLRDRRAYAVLPVGVQNDIAQQGRAAVSGAVLGPRERALWS